MSSSGGHGLGRTRARILQVLLNSSDPATVNSLAKQLGLHPNSARFHLDGLVEAGYATKSPKIHGRGRPRLIYRATQSAPDVTNQHLRQLVTVLVDEVISQLPDPMAAAEQAGYRWGRAITPDQAACPVAALVEHANELGFLASAEEDQITFGRCPYQVTGDPSTNPICGVHLGMMKGFLDSADASVAASKLSRHNGACHLRLNPIDGSAPAG